MAQWQSISLVMRRLWVRFPPPAPKRGRHPMDDDLFLVLRVSPVLLAHGLSLPPREVAQRAGEGEEGFARRGHAKTEIEAFFDLRPPAPPGLLTIQRRYFVRRKTLSRPQAKSLPCARGGGPKGRKGCNLPFFDYFSSRTVNAGYNPPAASGSPLCTRGPLATPVPFSSVLPRSSPQHGRD